MRTFVTIPSDIVLYMHEDFRDDGKSVSRNEDLSFIVMLATYGHFVTYSVCLRPIDSTVPGKTSAGRPTDANQPDRRDSFISTGSLAMITGTRASSQNVQMTSCKLEASDPVDSDENVLVG